MCGLQGSGKTTHSAKLGKYFKKEGHHPLLAACDVYRPAAIDQLCIVGEKAGVPVFQLGQEKPEVIAKRPMPTPRTTAMTSSFWIPPAVCTSTRS